MKSKYLINGAWMVALSFSSAGALTPAEIQKNYANTPSMSFSAVNGEKFYNLKGTDWSCASCHTANPKNDGKHATTGRLIAPLAPIANPERLTDAKKVEKWFTRNCKEVHGRECTAQEKGDFIQYLLSVQ